MNEVLLYSNVLLWVVVLLIGFTLFILFRQFGEVYLSTGESIARDGIAIGDHVPLLNNRRTLNGQTVRDQPGKPTLMLFLSPTCEACKDLIPDWNQAFHERNDIHFRVIAVGNKEKTAEMVKTRKLEGELIPDEDHSILEKHRVRVTPFAFILDEKGVVRGKGLCNGMEHIHGLISYLNSDFVRV
ncbi:methylamine dehydrogenase accessory protein MauD [Melghirimyces profundicolus]|uniref:Methylamine dehydrogenase accessory protein MauD n=1 Tax=Melghirimyces profundicolus TaxID=1242148 RepID=A0A2T6C7V7_9BACL|nr:redoxin domain-containing protein [Melghirimyces profundicolus]PTX64408.1 methylamine dehydrogenase accessory protein MauD [Melghirimyces profundicolus]